MPDSPPRAADPIIVLAGGGTGGHVYPALAMGEALRDRGYKLLYYGNADRIEGRVVPERGIEFHGIPALQFPRSGLMSKVAFAWGLLRTVLYARSLLKRHRATMVLGVGGYISAPPVLAAWTLGLPRVIHEQNAQPGLANRLCARVANLVFLTFEDARDRLPGKAEKILVGCPVHPRVFSGDRAAALNRYGLVEGKTTLLVVGGSLGAATLNNIGEAAAKQASRNYQVVVITGPKYEAEFRARFESIPSGVAIVGYEDRMADAYAAADLVVCRAGSSTLTELTAVGKPSVLVPSPNVTDNHQEHNARGLETVGAAIVITEAELDMDKVLDRIQRMMRDPRTLSTMAAAAKAQARLDTVDRVADMVEERFLKRA